MKRGWCGIQEGEMESRKRVRRSNSDVPNSSDSLIHLIDDNILLRILDNIEDRYDRQAWCLTCKHFLRLEAGSKQRIQLIRPEVLPGVLHRYTNLLHLDVSHCIQLPDESLALIGQVAGRTLLSLNLSRLGGFTSVGLAILARHCTRLVDVDLSYCSNLKDCDLLALAQVATLQALKLNCCHCISDIGLGCLAAGCKNIQLLSLKGCLGITDIGIRLVASNCQLLHTLDLSYTEVTDEGLASIATLHKLEVLNLVSCYNVDDQGLISLQNSCKSLLKLDVSRCSKVSDAGLAALASGHLALQQLTLSYRCSIITDELLATFQKFDRLQSIILDGCEIAQDGLPFIARGCKQLRELSLSKCKGVSDKGMAAVAAGCTALHRLDLTCCRELTNASLCQISTHCKALESLKMESCKLINEDGLRAIGDGCPRLEELDFTECNMSDTGLKYISKCTALRSLKLGFCCEISDRGAAHIGARCCNLRELDFYRSKGIGDAGVAAVAAGCPKLKVMDLSYCTRITDCSLQSLSQLRELQRLELRGCELVSSAGIAVMASGCKRLSEIDIKRCSQIGNAGLSALSFFCPGLRMMNISYCPISNGGLLSLTRLSCLQSVRLVHLKNVTLECYVNVLLSCKSLKNVKLPSYLRLKLPPGVAEEMESRGCRIRWMDKSSLAD